MSCFVRRSKGDERTPPVGLSPEHSAPAGRARAVAFAVALIALGGVPVVASMTPAMAATSHPSSHKVVLIPGPGPVPADQTYGIMPTSKYVSGRPSELFSKFSFTNLPVNQVTSAALSGVDTAVLIQVKTSSLSPGAKAALTQFVASGGKLIIHDADETHLNDYSWILPGSIPTQVGSGCPNCGLTSGSAQIMQNSPLISANAGDPSYVNLSELQKFTDAIGDANLLVSMDPRWFAAAQGTNARGETGVLVAYASYNGGLVIYNGFDTDLIGQTPAPPWKCVSGGYPNYTCPAGGPTPSSDWLAQMWYSELNLSWPFPALPQTTPVTTIGTPVPPTQAGLPSTKRCVAHRKLFLNLKKLVHNQPRVMQIDVYVKGRHVLREKGHWRNVSLTRLPKKGSYVVKIVATTKRHYHLISRKTYHSC